MPRTARELIAELEATGWHQTSQVGGHRHFEHPQRPGKVTVSGGLGETPPPGTLSSMRRQAGTPTLGRRTTKP